MKKIFFLIILIAVIVSCSNNEQLNNDNGLELSKAMGTNDSIDFSRALQVKEFEFPLDHGPHNDFRTEWWYITGNLISDENQKFGYQFTIFRTALTRKLEERESNWNSNQIYMGHFAISDIENENFYFEERFSRNGNNLAGAKINPIKIWIEDWELKQMGGKVFFDLPELQLKSSIEEGSLELVLKAEKPFVLQGENGLSQKGSEPGNASYYYSYTRLNTSGELILNGKNYKVSGNSWLDREWSTSALDENQSGWDWFALQLDNKTEIMYYQMRTKDGKADIFSKGVYVDEFGSYELLRKEDVLLEVLEIWESPIGGEYPSGWKLTIPKYRIDLEILPAIKNQLMDVTIKYWEGSVNIFGYSGKQNISGRGYVEMTGY